MAIYSTPARPVKRRRRGRSLATAAVSLLALVVIGGGVLVYGINQAQGPIDAAKAFCNDLKTQSYDAAYTLLSSGYQARKTKDQFITEATLHYQIDGAIVDCGQPNTGVFTFSLGTSNTQRLDVQITRVTSSKPVSGSISLVKQGSDWKVDGIDAALLGTDLGAFEVSQAFCTDFLAGDYASAYGLFSANAQQNYGSEQQFESTFKNAFSGTLKLTACAPDATKYSVNSPSAQVPLKAAVTQTTSAGASTIPISSTLKCILVNGTWKVNELDLNVPSA